MFTLQTGQFNNLTRLRQPVAHQMKKFYYVGPQRKAVKPSCVSKQRHTHWSYVGTCAGWRSFVCGPSWFMTWLTSEFIAQLGKHVRMAQALFRFICWKARHVAEQSESRVSWHDWMKHDWSYLVKTKRFMSAATSGLSDPGLMTMSPRAIASLCWIMPVCYFSLNFLFLLQYLRSRVLFL